MPDNRSRVTFGEFEMDLERGELWRIDAGAGREAIDLPPQAARLLALLVNESGRLVERETLRAELWGERWVDWESALHQAVRRVRAALGDDREPRRFVQTVARRGYRFVAEVEEIAGRTTDRERRGRLRLGVAALLLIASLAAFGWIVGRAEESSAVGVADEIASAEAQRLYREGLHLMSLARGEEALRRLETAAGHAPRWSAPWSAIAEVQLVSPSDGRVERSRRAIEKALARDATDARAWRMLSSLRMWEEWDWVGARAALERAIELDAGNADGWQLLAALETVSGREAEALAAAERAVELDPVSTARRADLGWTLYYFGHAERAAAECRRGLEIDSLSATAWLCLQQALLLDATERGEPIPAEAVDGLRRRLQGMVDETACVNEAGTAVPRLLTGDRDGAIEALVAGARLGSGWDLPFAIIDPLLAPLDSEPRVTEVRNAVGIPAAL